MQSGPRPEAIDTGLVFRVYAGCAIGSGAFVYLWPGAVFAGLTAQPDLVGVPFGRVALVRMAAAVVTSVGVVAAGLASMDAPLARRRSLYVFAFAHLVAGAMCLAPWIAVLDGVISPWTVWAPGRGPAVSRDHRTEPGRASPEDARAVWSRRPEGRPRFRRGQPARGGRHAALPVRGADPAGVAARGARASRPRPARRRETTAVRDSNRGRDRRRPLWRRRGGRERRAQPDPRVRARGLRRDGSR